VPFLICSENIISSKQLGFIPNMVRRVTFALIVLRHALRRKNMGTVDRFVRALSQTFQSIDPTCIISGGCLSLISIFVLYALTPLSVLDVAKAHHYHHTPFTISAWRKC
jgi:hypothetical protein